MHDCNANGILAFLEHYAQVLIRAFLQISAYRRIIISITLAGKRINSSIVAVLVKNKQAAKNNFLQQSLFAGQTNS